MTLTDPASVVRTLSSDALGRVAVVAEGGIGATTTYGTMRSTV